MNPSSVANKMLHCDITNGYDGLDDLELLATTDPELSWQIIWNVLTKGADPGKDDGAMCLELMKIASSSNGRQAVDSHLLSTWNCLPCETRSNLIHGFGDSDVVSLGTVVTLFDAPSTTVWERHHICATLASCRYDESPQIIVDMVMRIGAYEDAERQAQLEAFVKSVPTWGHRLS